MAIRTAALNFLSAWLVIAALLAGCGEKRATPHPAAAIATAPKSITITAAQVFNRSMIGQTWVFENGYGEQSTIEVQASPPCVAGVCEENVVFHYTKSACRAYWQPGICGAELWFTLHREADGSWRDIGSKIIFPTGCPYELCIPHNARTVLTQNVLPMPGRPLPYTVIPASGSTEHTMVRTEYKSHWQRGVLTDEPVTPDFPVRNVKWSTATWVETVTTPLTGKDPVNCLVSHQTEDSVEEHWCFAPRLGLVSVIPVRANKPLDPRLTMKRIR
ncbi:MAG: hypothetical protein LAP21_14195 [Acidobacteriia bacterium]|nr:hypothetical protein [Terriglobia bacterium]